MKVLLTGGSGFLGRHCLETLLARGHTVITTVRDDKKGNQIVDAYPNHRGKLSYVIVRDVAADGAFDQAVVSDPPIEAVLHTASPFHYHADDPKKDMIDPAIRGTTQVLHAIKAHAPSVKHVVITSSFAAVTQIGRPPPPLYTSEHWNPITMDQALSGGALTYAASKTFAEKAAWNFIKTENPTFVLTAINPVMIFGPAVQQVESLDHINTSSERFRDIVLGKWKDSIPPNTFQWIDVRDVALGHVLAIETPETAGKRLLAAAGPYSNSQLAIIAREKYPELRDKLPEKIEEEDLSKVSKIDASPLKELLGGTFRPLEQAVADAVGEILRIQASMSARA